MYKLKNETRNNQIRNVLDELTCHLTQTNDVILEIESPIISDKEFDYAEENYGNQQDSSDDYVSAKPGDPSIRYLFMIPVADLPCEKEKPTEPPYNYLNTPAFAEINSGCHRICAVLSLILFAVLACLT